MKLLAICYLFFLVSCQNNPNCPGTDTSSLDKQEASSDEAQTCDTSNLPDENEELPPDELPPEVAEVPQEAYLFQANLSFTKFGATDEDKVHKAVEIIQKVIQSEEFKERVLNFTYKGKKTFYNTKLTNPEVYQRLIDGAEDLLPETDHEMDLDLELYYSSRNTIGYTYASGLRIWMNKKYFNVYSPAEVAGNLFHEWTHKLGFTHSVNSTPSRPSSVPYAIGYLIRELGKQYE